MSEFLVRGERQQAKIVLGKYYDENETNRERLKV